jgi:hypothetical protein
VVHLHWLPAYWLPLLALPGGPFTTNITWNVGISFSCTQSRSACAGRRAAGRRSGAGLMRWSCTGCPLRWRCWEVPSPPTSPRTRSALPRSCTRPTWPALAARKSSACIALQGCRDSSFAVSLFARSALPGKEWLQARMTCETTLSMRATEYWRSEVGALALYPACCCRGQKLSAASNTPKSNGAPRSDAQDRAKQQLGSGVREEAPDPGMTSHGSRCP